MKQEPLLRIEVESRTTPDKVYVVTQWYKEPEFRCSCPGWLFKYRALGEDCKHISAVKQDIENTLRMNMPELIKQAKEYYKKFKNSEVKTSPKVAGGVMLRKLLID